MLKIQQDAASSLAASVRWMAKIARLPFRKNEMDVKSNLENAPANAEISCTNCKACCCQLEVLLMGDDDVPDRLTIEDQWGGTVMRRLDDDWCVALDRGTMLCTIYQRRPGVCREFEVGDYGCLEERLQLVVQYFPQA
jgi:Fe-S-cluster containining protein